MSIQLELSKLPQDSRVDVNIHVTASLTVSAQEARRRVSRLVISEVGNLLYAGEPSLSIGERIHWRVPVVLAYPDLGEVGEVGALDVDVETGAILATADQLTAIFDYALYLAERSAAGPT